MAIIKKAGPFGVLKGLLDKESELGEFIKNGPSTGLQGWVRDRYRHRCNEFANLPGWARALTLGAGGSVRRICEPYWDDNGWDGPTTEPPFSGGQCEGVVYRVFRTARNPSTGVVTGEFEIATGVGPWRIVPTGSNPCSAPCFPGDTCFDDALESGDGSVRVTLASGCAVFRSWVSLRFEVISGTEPPGGCGDPPREPVVGPNPPPDPGPLPGPEPTTDPDDPTGPPLIPIPPFDDPFGGPTPIEGPEIYPGPGPDAPTSPPPGDVGEPGGEVIAEPGDDAEGEAPEGSVLVGLRLRLVVIPPRPNEWEPGIYRGVGYAYMGTAEGLDQDMAGAYISDGQFIFAEKDNLTHWRFRATNEFQVGVTPFYREVEE